jgi:hypothetical protein
MKTFKNLKFGLKIYAIVITVSFIVLLIKYFKVIDDSHTKQVDLNFIQGGDITKANRIDSLQNRCDSLYDELFHAKLMAGRYELTFEHLKEVNPELGKQMENWMIHETE